ncbi:Peptidase-M14 domain-containing protein [Aphelenchoides bicaudatus]|nr:Peptidase-M14 domain-containing protein [Aphelenchoides bicaudatus]
MLTQLFVLLLFLPLHNASNQWQTHNEQDNETTTKDYTNYKLLRINPKNEENRRFLWFLYQTDPGKAIYDERSNHTEVEGVHQDSHFLRFDRYNNLDQIEEYLFRIREEYPKIVSIVEIGKTYENRSIYLMKIGKKTKEPPLEPRPAIWIDATIHARRPTTCVHKTPLSALCCTGVDLNRNFDWFWGTTGSSADPCHDTYHGTSPFSENESLAVKSFLEQNKVNAFITMHSYSQFWLIPYGHKKRAYPTDYHTMLKPLALKATKALTKLYGTKYAVGTGADLMYEASGASHDYAKGTLQIPIAYLLELRPQNTLFANGFLLPEREIQPTAEETFEAIKVVAQDILDEVENSKQKPTPHTTLPYTTTPVTTTTEEIVEESTTTEATTQAPVTEQITEEPITEETTIPTEIPETTPQIVTISTEGPTLPPKPSTESPIDSNSGETNVIQPHRIVQCANHGRYCKWWKIHNLCENDRVRKLCSLSCLPECSIK